MRNGTILHHHQETHTALAQDVTVVLAYYSIIQSMNYLSSQTSIRKKPQKHRKPMKNKRRC
jgi:hypothetical protein